MAESTIELTATGRAARSSGIATIAWRNLWRNRRRTWLTSGGIAFAVWMLVFTMSLQVGSFEMMIDNGARLALGHVQLQHPDYRDDPRMEFTLTGTSSLKSQVADIPGVEMVAARAQGFALASSAERSFGAQVIGVEAAAEGRWSSLPGMLHAGRYLAGPGEAFIGSVLARNLAVGVGEEIVLLGTASEGGVAAIVADVVGIFETGVADVDRALLQIPIDDFRAGWNLGPDESHAIVVLTESVSDSQRVAARIRAEVQSEVPLASLDWRALMPETEQMLDMKMISTQMLFAVIAIIVTFSIVNTFMMTVFERTQEFGMLMAIGMRPARMVRQLAMEAFYLSVVGVALGLTISIGMVVVLAETGIPLPVDADELLKQYNMPDRMYPAFSTSAAVVSTLIMIIGTQIASLIPALRILRMRPVEALRAQD